MQGIERGQLAQGLDQNGQQPRVALAVGWRVAILRQAKLDLGDLMLRGAHHAGDDRDTLGLENTAAQDHAPARQGRQQPLAVNLWSTIDPVIQRPVAEPGLGQDFPGRRPLDVHLACARGGGRNVGHVFGQICAATAPAVAGRRAFRCNCGACLDHSGPTLRCQGLIS